MIRAKLSQLPERVGEPLGRTPWRLVDFDRVAAFMTLTGTPRPLGPAHDVLATTFWDTLVPPSFVLSLCSGFLAELLEVSDAAAAVDYSVDQVRYPALLNTGARIRARGKLFAVNGEAWGAETVAEISVDIKGDTRPACVARFVSRYYSSTRVDDR